MKNTWNSDKVEVIEQRNAEYKAAYETVKTYTCSGDVRGECGVKHRTVGAAARHLSKDQRDCRSIGGYSDRRVVGIAADGELLNLSQDDQHDAWSAEAE